MGRGSFHVCKTCDVYQNNGYGSYSTWLDFQQDWKIVSEHIDSLAAYDRQAARYPELAKLGKNMNVRAFLVAHDGHKIEFVSGDDENSDEKTIYSSAREVPHPHHFGCDCKKVK